MLELHRQQDSAPIQAIQDSAAPQIAGLLLRSEVVSGWPGLQIDAYNSPLPLLPSNPTEEEKKKYEESDTARRKSDLGSSYRKLPCLRMERLSNDVLIALFDVSGSSNKSIQMVDMHLHPETLHFGFDVPEGNQNADLSKLTKDLRSSDTGKQISVTIEESKTGIDPPTRVVDVVSLAKNILTKIPQAPKDDSGKLRANVFALEMLAGMEMVRFIRQPST